MDSLFREGNRKSQKFSPFEKISRKHGSVPIHLIPIALRKAKIVYNFGLSECNKVQLAFTANSSVV